jgi:hypothetical protein
MGREINETVEDVEEEDEDEDEECVKRAYMSCHAACSSARTRPQV